MTLPTDDKSRKGDWPLWDFMFGYFPKAWLQVVRVAVEGNKQHNPGEPLHWARGKSMDQLNTAFRHLFDYGTGTKKDTDGQYHLAKAIWRLMAQLQLEIEEEENALGTKHDPGDAHGDRQGKLELQHAGDERAAHAPAGASILPEEARDRWEEYRRSYALYGGCK